MRLINIEPYTRRDDWAQKDKAGKPIIQELIDNMRRKGQLDGVEIDVVSGTTVGTKESRDDEVLAHITIGVLERIREYSEMGTYDAIVCQGSIEPGFYAGREISKIPVAFAVHSSAHVASLIGEKFSVLELTDTMAHIVRRHIKGYGFGEKLASVRKLGLSSTQMGAIVNTRKKEERAGDPEIQRLLELILEQCKAAVDKDGADTIILGCPPLQYLEDEIRQKLDQAGYQEIQLISELAAAIEMAKVMVNMKLIQSPKAFPSDGLKAKPEHR